jgi:hypothetical protein
LSRGLRGSRAAALLWSRRQAIFAVAVLTALVVWVFWHHLFDHWTFPWDFLGTYTTTPAFVAATFGSGHPLAWSPFVASGFPVDVNPQAGLYFPGWWALGAIGVPATLRVLTAVQIAHVLFGSVGVYALARARRVGPTWALVAGVAYLFFGGFYGQAEHADIVRGFAYLPWLLWALTPPVGEGRWTRLAALPPLAWLIASGAYPGEVVSFGLMGLVYVAVALRGEGAEAWRQHRLPLVLAVAACAAVCAVVLLPYLRAEQAGELHRTIEPTALLRAGWAFSPLDALGLYLNNFAWTADGTVTAWAIGVPILIGLACTRIDGLRRHAPLAACGTAALLLAMTPKIGPIGRAMVAVRPLFPSRFPASDYKAVVAVALIVLSADAWSRLPARGGTRPWTAAVIACLVVAGALAAPSTHGSPTRALWVVLVVIVASTVLVFLRPRAGVLASVLVLLVCIDGAREINDYRSLGVVSPWQAETTAFYIARDGHVRKLPKQVASTPKSRPARVPAASTAEPNASGWVADAYHMTDYDPTVERALWQAESSPDWLALMLEPWHGFTFPCAAVGCAGAVHLPPATTWRPAAGVQTLNYGPTSIVYSVKISHPVLMVENELAISGWHANTASVRVVNAGIPLRAWRLPAGNYRFVASFQEPGRPLQYLALAAAILAWLASLFTLRRRRENPRGSPRVSESG